MGGQNMITERQMLERASRAVGKIDMAGKRGLTMVSMDELEAMALSLVHLGLVAVVPGRPMPEQLVVGRV